MLVIRVEASVDRVRPVDDDLVASVEARASGREMCRDAG
jgi:hypothetical protein